MPAILGCSTLHFEQMGTSHQGLCCSVLSCSAAAQASVLKIWSEDQCKAAEAREMAAALARVNGLAAKGCYTDACGPHPSILEGGSSLREDFRGWSANGSPRMPESLSSPPCLSKLHVSCFASFAVSCSLVFLPSLPIASTASLTATRFVRKMDSPPLDAVLHRWTTLPRTTQSRRRAAQRAARDG